MQEACVLSFATNFRSSATGMFSDVSNESIKIVQKVGSETLP